VKLVPVLKKRCKIIIVLFVIAALLLSTPGCWDLNELEDLAYVMAMGIDFLPEERLIEVTTAVMRAQGGGEEMTEGGETELIRLVTTKGVSFSGALEQQKALIGRQVFFYHSDTFIIGENLAREGLHHILDRIARERDLRLTAEVFITDNNIAEVMRAGARLDPGLPFFARQWAKRGTQRSLAPLVDLREFLRDLLTGGRDPVLPHLTIREEVPISPIELEMAGQTGTGEQPAPEDDEGQVVVYPKISGTAVFNEDTLAGFLDQGQTKGLLYVQGDILEARDVIDDPFGKPGRVVICSMSSRARIIPLWKEGSPAVLIEIKEEGDIC